MYVFIAIVLAAVSLGQTAPSTPADAAKPAQQTAPPALQLADPLSVFDAAKPTVIANGLSFAEGPLWHEGKLFICDLGGDTVYTISPCKDDPATPEKEEWTKTVVFRKPSSRAAGSAIDAEGRLLLAHFAGLVTRTEKDGTVTTIADGTMVNGTKRPLAKCNDLAIHRNGTIFFTDFGKKGSESKGLFRIAPKGDVEALDGDYAGANGVALSPDQKTLYVADYGKNILIAYDIADDASVSKRRVFVDLSADKAGGRTDGLKVDASGRVFTTGPGGIWVIGADGKPMTRLDMEGGASNLCFGGPDGLSAFITSGEQVFQVGIRPPPAADQSSPGRK